MVDDPAYSAQLKEIKKIEDRIEFLTQKLSDKQPTKFKIRDLVHDFFASLIVGLTLTFKGNLSGLIVMMENLHVISVIISTIIILTLQIYYVGYIKVSDKEGNPFFGFWIKRFLGFYIVAILVSSYIVFMFALNKHVQNSYDVIKMVIALSMPCAIGAAIPTMFKEY